MAKQGFKELGEKIDAAARINHDKEMEVHLGKMKTTLTSYQKRLGIGMKILYSLGFKDARKQELTFLAKFSEAIYDNPNLNAREKNEIVLGFLVKYRASLVKEAGKKGSQLETAAFKTVNARINKLIGTFRASDTVGRELELDVTKAKDKVVGSEPELEGGNSGKIPRKARHPEPVITSKFDRFSHKIEDECVAAYKKFIKTPSNVDQFRGDQAKFTVGQGKFSDKILGKFGIEPQGKSSEKPEAKPEA